jgi:predicted PurR-regulated permease PerM
LIGLGIVVALAAAREASEVALPAVWALLTVCAVYPLFAWLKARMPQWLAAALVLVSLLALLAGISAGFGCSMSAFRNELSEDAWDGKKLEAFGQTLSVEDAKEWVETRGAEWTSQGITMMAGLVLMLALSTLGLLESSYVKRWSKRHDLQRLHRLFAEFGRDIRRYLVVRTVLGVITGTVVALGCWLLGVRLPLVWGFSNFLLNFIPTVGSVLGVIPPVAFTLADTGDPTQALVPLAVVGGAKLVLGNWVDPLLQGKYLEISPTVVLLAVTFWGWLWGPWGAFVGVPLMLFIGRACQMAPASEALGFLIVRSSSTSQTSDS